MAGDVCKRCNHVHRGETRETTRDECGVPWSEGRSFGWCICRSVPGQVLQDGSIYQPIPMKPNITCRHCGTQYYQGLVSSHSTGLLKPCPGCRRVEYCELLVGRAQPHRPPAAGHRVGTGWVWAERFHDWTAERMTT